MEIDVAGLTPDFLRFDKQSSVEAFDDLEVYFPTLMASQEYAILDESTELNLADYADLDSVFRYDPFDAVDAETATTMDVTTAQCISTCTRALKRVATELDGEDVDKEAAKTPCRRSENGRLESFGWKKEPIGQCGSERDSSTPVRQVTI